MVFIQRNISLATKSDSSGSECWVIGHLNADDLQMVRTDGSKSSKVKVLIVYPSDVIVVPFPKSQQTASLVINIILEN